MRENGKPTLPTAEEIEKITPIIKDEFVKHGIEIENIGPHPYGGLVAEARIRSARSERCATRCSRTGSSS